MIGTIEAARLLKICTQRVRQLLYEGRIVGAKKVGKFWQIPLINQMPKVIEGKRGPKGTWRKRVSSALTRIHVNSHKIRSNNHGTKEPVIIIRSGSEKIYAHGVQINGSCNLIYRPEKPLDCGATLWIEVEPDVVVKPFIFANMTRF
ncbi:helix-turn-helix domain-containing protein [Plectonema cf. radiosum LEGE 06105]|uniref:Helix-turn-helix domain-containing protein n=1 Tax=Plectonema cf. radiosum LEGE 06105 TaxID=945769 RepID=A0A8J7K290_9CYAN|nr:helix-turn-helix domain-containing protein [Plectonema radiosum]MBE9213817.1 helix-turn-helix domain-containing protein [Plectonema cf. radiosum LEGE 06105]